MNDYPVISVIMPVYNTEKYLGQSIESILNQTYTNFEFLIFDDGSTDSSPDIIRKYAQLDQRIIPFFSNENIGYVEHLNTGIKQARGEFIARMDSDDIALLHRFDTQLKYLNEHPNIDIVGSGAILINEEGRELRISHQETDSILLKWALFFYNPFYHPSLLIRKSYFSIAGMYDVKMQPAEDRDMWLRGWFTSKFANIHQPLIKYRVHPKSTSVEKQQLQASKSEYALLNHYGRFLGVNLETKYIPFFREFHKKDIDISQMNDQVLSTTLISIKSRFYTTYNSELSDEIRRKIDNDVFIKLLYIAVNKIKQRKWTSIKVISHLVINYPLLCSQFLLKRLIS